MAVLFTSSDWAYDRWIERLERLAPDRTFLVHGVHDYDPAAIRYVLTWKPPAGLLASLPNLSVIFNLGAGVDALMSGEALPDVPIVRLVDDDLTLRMGEWVALQVLYHHRRQAEYLERQRRRRWEPLPQSIASEVRVGVMGFGVLGAHAAKVLSAIGYRVHGWSRSPRADVPVDLFVGEAELGAFLARTDVLVCLLPLTPQTRGILDARLIARLARDGPMGGPVLINAGRGGVQVSADIAAALETGALAGAMVHAATPDGREPRRLRGRAAPAGQPAVGCHQPRDHAPRLGGVEPGRGVPVHPPPDRSLRGREGPRQRGRPGARLLTRPVGLVRRRRRAARRRGREARPPPRAPRRPSRAPSSPAPGPGRSARGGR